MVEVVEISLWPKLFFCYLFIIIFCTIFLFNHCKLHHVHVFAK